MKWLILCSLLFTSCVIEVFELDQGNSTYCFDCGHDASDYRYPACKDCEFCSDWASSHSILINIIKESL